MPFIDVNIHFIWSTKNRMPLLPLEIRNELFQHILTNARRKEIFIESIGGFDDHIHALISLPSELSMAKTIQLIKGESSHWMNREKIIQTKFEWQDEYYAISVSPDQVGRVKAYIANQDAHHRRKSFSEEIDGLMKMLNFKKSADIGLKPGA